MPRKSAAELKKQRRADRWGVGSADTPPVEGAPTPSELTNQWVETHYNDKAPDGVAWGAHVKQWRGDGARDTHISAIIAATTYTKNATITAITLTDLLEDYDPPVFGVEFTHPANVQDNNGLTPLLFVLKIVYGWLHSEKMARTALLREKIKVGLLKVLKALKSDSDFLYAAPGGITALHLAIGLEYACLGEECIESLLACGCDPDAPLDESGDRPVHLAARHNPNALKPLLQGVAFVRRPGDESEEEPEASLASPNARNFKGESPLDIAVRMRYVSSVALLLQGGADPNVLDADGDTPLAKAEYDQINFGGWAIATLLKDHGALALIPEEPYDEDHWTAHWEKCCTRASDRGLDDDAEESGLEALPPDVARRRHTIR